MHRLDDPHRPVHVAHQGHAAALAHDLACRTPHVDVDQIGLHELLGARPLARIIQEHIKRPLADEILFGELEDGGRAHFDLTDGKLTFTVKPLTDEERAAIDRILADEEEPEEEDASEGDEDVVLEGGGDAGDSEEPSQPKEEVREAVAEEPVEA